MKFLKGVKQTIDNARSGVVDTSSLTPEQLARYEAQMAKVDSARVESQRSWDDAVALGEAHRAAQVLQGRAGEHVHGRRSNDSPAAIEAAIAEHGMRGMLRQQMSRAANDTAAAVRETFGRDLPPGVEDPAERAPIEQAERAARDAARAPYRAAEAHPVHLTRIPTRGKTQIDELAAHLAATGLSARPDLMYGVYRVPDRISPALTSASERGRVVEWDIVHAAPPGLPPGPLPSVLSLSAHDHWVARRVNEPSIVDEDLGAHILASLGIAPELTLGVARAVRMTASSTGGTDTSPMRARVDGMVILHASPHGPPAAFDAMAATTPLALPPGPPPGAHLEVLNWGAIATVVHPYRQRLHHLPSPFTHLPSTPQELLTMYLEVVGVRPFDAFSAQVTVDAPDALWAQLTIGGFDLGTSNTGRALPCADGKPRARLHGADHIVVAYRDRPDYAEGRDRWAAYEREVLEAYTRNQLGLRAPVVHGDHRDFERSLARKAARVANAVDALLTFGESEPLPPPYRYCMPIVD